jgi:RNA 2',3'-cyclic 3'-phosphodiesterase
VTAVNNASTRLFVALWPAAAVRAALAASSRQWSWNAGAARVPAERLHLTLHFLGAVPRERMPALRAALALPFAPFALTLSRPELWAGGIAVLEPARIPPALAELRAALGAALQRAGLASEGRPWRPHLTLARRAAGATPPARCTAPCWRVNGFALVESRLAAGYTVLQRYPARAWAPLERSQRDGNAVEVE